MDLFVEVRQVVAAGPFLNLLRLTIWTAVAIAIALVQPPLVLALELVVQGDSIDARTPLGELLGLPQVGVEDLRVVLDFTGLDEARIELLRLTTLALTVRVQQVATPIGQHDDMVSMTIEAFRSDESLFAQMAEVAGPRIGRAVVVPTQ